MKESASSLTDELIRCVPLFSMLPDHKLAALVSRIEKKKIPKGKMIFREGHQEGRFFILLEGEVEVIKAMGTPDERLLAIRKPCSFLGELSLFNEDGTHTASVRSHTDLELMEIPRVVLDDMLRANPDFAYEMIRTLSKRLVAAEDLTIQDLRRKNQELTRLYEELKAAQMQIIEKERYEKELEVARTIQRSILPRREFDFPKFNSFACMEAMTSVGGDFYDFINLDEQTIGVVIGDVSDHGVPAALFMALSVTLIRSQAALTRTPAQVLAEVNRLLLNMNDAGMFVTVLYGVLHADSNRFRYARAGHEYPIIISSEGEQIHLPTGTGQPLGLFDDCIIDEGEFPLRRGSMLTLYTDGITESQNTDRAMFGVEGLSSILKGMQSEDARTAVETVWSELANHRGLEPIHDDLTLVIIKPE